MPSTTIGGSGSTAIGGSGSTTIVNSLVVLVNDIHVSSTANGADPTTLAEARDLADQIISLRPHACVDLGDDGEQAHDGNATEAKENFFDRLTAAGIIWIRVPGNHDADVDSTDEAETETFVFQDAVFGGPPYHRYLDWPGPNIRFILPHTYLQHPPAAGSGFWWIDASERSWAAATHDARPSGWKSFIGAHPPSDNATFGNGIHNAFGGTEWRAWLASEAANIVAVAHGHRHIVPATSSLSGITHINGACGSYWTSWNHGGFMKLLWNQADNTITVTPHRGRTPFEALTIAGFPLVLNLD